MAQNIDSQDLKLKLTWKNLSLIQKSKNKIILDNLSGQVKSGDFLAIMGSSGAGKSSFLSMVTRTLSSFGRNFIFKGKINFNNQDYTEEEFFAVCSFVPQDDLLLQTLTVRQVFNFQAKLKLYYKSDCEKQQKITQVLKRLNLYQVRDSSIGGSRKKSISGGQKKRVAIGIQLLSDPMSLVLDQPTSGLDSSNSLKIIRLLSRLAKQQNKLIITTIHQPSTLMFQNFDKLMVLHKGKQIYFDKAIKMVSYMESLKIEVDYRMNPADFFMLQISSFKQNQKYVTPMTQQNFKSYKRNNKLKKQSEVIQEKQQYPSINYKIQKSVPVLDQFKPLIQRNYKNFIRCPSNQGGRIMQLLVFPTFAGIVFHDILSRVPLFKQSQSTADLQTFLSQLVSFFYLCLFFTICQSVYDTILVFPSQKQLILKQVHSKMYFMSAYYISKLIIELPLMFISVIMSSSVLYAVIGLENSTQHWFYYCIFFLNQVFTFCAVAYSGYMIGISIGALCKNQLMAIQASVLIMMPVMTFGGQSVNLKYMPQASKWVQYITPLRYGYNILLKNQLQDERFEYMGNDPYIQDILGLEDSTHDNMVGLLLLCFALTVLSFLVLYGRRKFG